MRTAPFGGHLEGVLSVVVVAVDDDEGFFDHILRHQHGMGGTPGLYSLGIEGEAGGNLVQFLGYENELQGCAVHALDVRIFLGHKGFHVFEEVFTDDVDHLSESGLHGIVDGIIDNGLSGRPQAVHLFESAITAAHSGSKN